MEQEVQGLIGLYDAGHISRRSFAQAVLALCLTSGAASKARAQPATSVVHARTLNHVSMATADVSRSKAFYERLTGLPIRDEGADFCEFRLENGFFGIYSREKIAPEQAQQLGINHFCIGVDDYEPKSLLARIVNDLPEAKPYIEFGNQVYLHDPDGAKVQFADVKYKR